MSDFQDIRDKEKTSRDRSAPFDVILRRFFREVQQSRILSEVKKRRYHFKDPSRKMRRESARRKAARKRVKRGY